MDSVAVVGCERRDDAVIGLDGRAAGATRCGGYDWGARFVWRMGRESKNLALSPGWMGRAESGIRTLDLAITNRSLYH